MTDDLRIVPLEAPDEGLHAVLVLAAGPHEVCAGGTRTWAYATPAEQLADAKALAQAMRHKCALAGLPVGGAKIVVQRPPYELRKQAFTALGRALDPFAGRLHTAGDLGTTPDDLAAMRAGFETVHLDDDGRLAQGVGESVYRCAMAALDQTAPASVAVQGVGDIGAAVLARFIEGGLAPSAAWVCDIDVDRAEAVAAAHGAGTIDPAAYYEQRVDLLSPCAKGGLLDAAAAEAIGARAVVGGANNILSDPSVCERLTARNVRFVPDPLSSSGAVIRGVCQQVLDDADPLPYFDMVANKAARAVAMLQQGIALEDVVTELIADAVTSAG